jgi:hypothetical protein
MGRIRLIAATVIVVVAVTFLWFLTADDLTADDLTGDVMAPKSDSGELVDQVEGLRNPG